MVYYKQNIECKTIQQCRAFTENMVFKRDMGANEGGVCTRAHTFIFKTGSNLY